MGTALLFFAAEGIGKKVPTSLNVTFKMAFFIGLAQTCALFPGVSRLAPPLPRACFWASLELKVLVSRS